MTDHPENPSEDPQPIHGQVRYSQVSARVPPGVGEGCYASAVMVMAGPFETVLDFILRLSEQPRVVARVVLPPTVVRQFIQALQKNIGIYEGTFGPLPKPPALVHPESRGEGGGPGSESAESSGESEEKSATAQAPPWTTHTTDPELQEPGLSPPQTTSIEQIYDELRLADSMLSGRYANAVLIRHSATEFSFDFITNIYPRSAVSSRVYVAAANVGALLQSLQRSVESRPQ